ncbi:MAG: hypothetical protein ACYC63_07580 [Armatimonadota bacterium]
MSRTALASIFGVYLPALIIPFIVAWILTSIRGAENPRWIWPVLAVDLAWLVCGACWQDAETRLSQAPDQHNTQALQELSGVHRKQLAELGSLLKLAEVTVVYAILNKGIECRLTQLVNTGDGYDVMLNRGRQHGLREDLQFTAWRKIDDFSIPIGVVRLYNVNARFSQARVIDVAALSRSGLVDLEKVLPKQSVALPDCFARLMTPFHQVEN